MKLYRVWIRGQLLEVPFPGHYAGIKTQKVFGRLDCWSGKRALKKNRVFFLFWEDAVEAGYRPCKHCKPEVISRQDCGHLPFGPNGPPAVETRPVGPDKIGWRCALCGQDVSRDKALVVVDGRVSLVDL